MKKRSRKSSTVSHIFAIRVIKDHIGRVKLQIIQWAHRGKDSKLKKFVRLLDAPPAPYLDEKQYRWCENDAETPTPLAAENTPISGVVNCDVLRLRANIANTGTKDAKAYLGLMYSDDGGVTWYALGGAPDAPANPHFEYQLSDFGIDGTTVTTLILTASDTAGVHIESVPTAELTIAVGTTVEYDFCIHCTPYASSYTTYLFKIIKTDETGVYLSDLDAYTTQPELTTGEVVVVVEKYATDSATGTDTPVVSAEIPVTDAGTGTDTPVVEGAIPVIDTGTGTDTPIVEGAIPVTDAGAGTDTPVVSTEISVTDVGTGTDTPIVEGAIPATDVGTGTDEVVSVEIPIDDLGSGIETITAEASVPVTDTGTGTDVIAVEGSLLVEDLGSGAEIVSVKGEIPATDVGSGTDVVVSIGIPIDDLGSGVETVTTEASVSVTDAGAGTDTPIVEGEIPATDAGVGSEVVSVEGAIPVTDDGVGSDVATLSYAEKKVEDIGTGTDVAEVLAPTAYDEIQDQRITKIEEDVEKIIEEAKRMI